MACQEWQSHQDHPREPPPKREGIRWESAMGKKTGRLDHWVSGYYPVAAELNNLEPRMLERGRGKANYRRGEMGMRRNGRKSKRGTKPLMERYC